MQRIKSSNYRKTTIIMDELQRKIWDLLITKDGETVANAFTSFYGTQLLTEEFAEHLIDEGYADRSDLFVDEDEDEDV